MAFDLFFNKEFWPKLVTTISGVALGIPAGLLIQRCVSSRRQKMEPRELLHAVKEALKKNLSLVEQLASEFSVKPREYTPLYPLDLTILDATAARKYELLDNIDAARAIDNARFELIHLNGKLALLREAATQVHGKYPGTAAEGWFFAIKDSIKAHLETVRVSINMALKFVGTQRAQPPTSGAGRFMRAKAIHETD